MFSTFPVVQSRAVTLGSSLCIWGHSYCTTGRWLRGVHPKKSLIFLLCQLRNQTKHATWLFRSAKITKHNKFCGVAGVDPQPLRTRDAQSCQSFEALFSISHRLHRVPNIVGRTIPIILVSQLGDGNPSKTMFFLRCCSIKYHIPCLW